MYLISVFRFFISGYIQEVSNSELEKQIYKTTKCDNVRNGNLDTELKQRMFDGRMKSAFSL